MAMTGSARLDAERAFTRARRQRRRAALMRRVRRLCKEESQLPVLDEVAAGGRPARGVREIPLDAIAATLEPSRARMFDRSFRPASSARCRWQNLWLAEHRGVPLPPISVVAVGDGYAVRDGHHRVSVARARGAVTIDATVDAVSPG